MIEQIFAAIFFFAPAGVANMVPIPAAKLPYLRELNHPIDGYKTWRGKRIFGDHKTVRGFVAGFVGAFALLVLERELFQSSTWIRESVAFVDYNSINLAWWALVFNFGVLGGDALKSFFKRQLDRPPGSTWFPFDQLDYVIGGILASLLLVRLEPLDYLLVAIIWFLAHPIATTIGWLLKLKDSPL